MPALSREWGRSLANVFTLENTLGTPDRIILSRGSLGLRQDRSISDGNLHEEERDRKRRQRETEWQPTIDMQHILVLFLTAELDDIAIK